MTTYQTTSYQIGKRTATETRRKARYIQEGDNDPVYVGSSRGTRTRTITVTRNGPYTQDEADAALQSGDTTNAADVGTVTTSNKVRANAAGMYYVDVTADVRGSWTWVDE